MLAGVWIVFAPTALMGACLSWLAISDKEITHGLLGIAMCLLSAAVILIATSNYFRLRK